MNTKKLTAIALLMVTALPLAQTAFAHDRDDDDRPVHTWHRDGDRDWDRGYHRDRDWRDGRYERERYRYRHDYDHGYYRGYYRGYYPQRDWDDRRATVVIPTPPLVLPPPLVPQLHKGRIVLRPAF